MAVSVAVTGVAWLQDLPDLTSDEAVQVAVDAMRAAGIDDAVVDPAPRSAVYASPSGAHEQAVWRTSVVLPDGTVELWIARSGGEPMFLDDRSDDGSSHLLTDAQFETLSVQHDNPAQDRRLRRNATLTAAALIAAGTAAGLGSAADGLVRPRRRHDQRLGQGAWRAL